MCFVFQEMCFMDDTIDLSRSIRSSILVAHVFLQIQCDPYKKMPGLKIPTNAKYESQ